MFEHLKRLVNELIPKSSGKRSSQSAKPVPKGSPIKGFGDKFKQVIVSKRVVASPEALNNQSCFSDIDIRTRKALKPDWGLWRKSLDPDGEMEKEKELLVKRLLKGY